jgi:hypothetical protein
LKKNTLLVSVIILLVFACKKEQDPFLISKQNIGLLTDSTQVKAIEAIYINDSIVKRVGGDEFTGAINDIEIYTKSGKQLLALTPSEALDSTATIKTIKILDSRFITEKGITINSTFKDIEDNYTISSIQNTITNVVIFINEINVFITIDKKVLTGELRFNSDVKIEAISIPDDAKIKYFMIGW